MEVVSTIIARVIKVWLCHKRMIPFRYVWRASRGGGV